MTDIMKLADDYAECMYLRREKHEARAALQSAIEVLQGKVERLIDNESKQQSRGAEFIELQTAAKMAIITLESGGVLGSTTTIKALKKALREDINYDE